MEFDVEGIRTVANAVLPLVAEDLRMAQQRLANAHLAGDPFHEDRPSGTPGKAMFEEAADEWGAVHAALQSAMTQTATGIDSTCAVLLQMAAQYEQTELRNTDSFRSLFDVS